MATNRLILFINNTISGKVKTRLATVIGDDRALDVYIRMLEHVRDVTGVLPMDKAIYYSDFIEPGDMFDATDYDKYLQSGGNKGERMYQAFAHAFADGYQKVVIICSDCFEISSSHIVDAFESLNETDIVLGPSTDGAYYLLGMNRFLPFIFKNKDWGSENVFLDTLIDIRNHGLGFRLLETLSDLETFDDLKRSGRFPDISGMV
jgi:uncharacterized protein